MPSSPSGENEVAGAESWEWQQLANAVSARFAQDGVLWTIIASFCTTSAVLMIALFASGELPESPIVSRLVCFTGFYVSLVWFFMQAAALRRVKVYEKLINVLENRLGVDEDLRLMQEDPEAGTRARWLPRARSVMPFLPVLSIIAWLLGFILALGMTQPLQKDGAHTTSNLAVERRVLVLNLASAALSQNRPSDSPKPGCDDGNRYD